MVLEDSLQNKCREGTNAVNRKAFFTYQGHLHYFVYCKETAIEPLNHQLTSSSNYHKT